MKNARGCAVISRLEMIAKWYTRKRQADRDRSRRVFQRKLRTELLESRQLMAADTAQHNVFDAEDVNDDGQCGPLDALLVIQELNTRAGSTSSSASQSGRVFADVNNDGQRSPADALQVINRLNQRGLNQPGPKDPASPKKRHSIDN